MADSQKEFNEKAIKAFQNIKNDMQSFKDSTQEWITYLNRTNDLLKEKIARLEAELSNVKMELRAKGKEKESKIKNMH